MGVTRPDISLATPSSGGTPSLKIGGAVGDYATVVICNVKDKLPVKLYGSTTGELETKADGTPKEQTLVTGIVVNHHNATISGDEPLETGQEVSIWLKSYDRWEWFQGIDGHGNVLPGDFMQWKFDREEPSEKAGNNDRKIRTVRLRLPEDKDQEWVDKAVAVYERMRSENGDVLVSAGNVADQFGGTVVDDTDPF